MNWAHGFISRCAAPATLLTLLISGCVGQQSILADPPVSAQPDATAPTSSFDPSADPSPTKPDDPPPPEPSSTPDRPVTTTATTVHDDPNATGSLSAFTDDEVSSARFAIAGFTDGKDLSLLTASLSRSTYGTSLHMLAPDVGIANPPVPTDTPVLLVRVYGPVVTSLTSSHPDTGVLQGTGAMAVLDPTDGRSLMVSIFVEGQPHTIDGVPTEVPMIDPALEQSAAEIPVTG